MKKLIIDLMELLKETPPGIQAREGISQHAFILQFTILNNRQASKYPSDGYKVRIPLQCKSYQPSDG